MKIFNPATDGSVTCLDIQNQVIQDVLSQLTGKQLNFYAVHGCEIIASSAQTFNGEKILKYNNDLTKSKTSTLVIMQAQTSRLLG